MIFAQVLAAFGGASLVVAGVAMIYPPAAYIVAGLFSLFWYTNSTRAK
jgi:hypothetical protein